jgi:hypothetical protein
MKIILRLLVLPFVAGFAFVGFIVSWFKLLINFVRFGGELIPYNKDSKTIQDVYSRVGDILDVKDYYSDQEQLLDKITNKNYKKLIKESKNVIKTLSK